MEQDNLGVRVDRIEGKLDALAVSIDERFDEVTDAIVEQRQYTDSAFTNLLGQMNAGFQRIERKLDGFIEVQTRTNELVEKRLSRLERPRRRSRR